MAPLTQPAPSSTPYRRPDAPSRDADLLRPSSVPATLAALFAPTVLFGLVFGSMGEPRTALVLGALLGPLAGLATWHATERACVRGEARVRDGRLEHPGIGALPVEAFTTGVAWQDETGAYVHLERRVGAALVLRVPSLSVARGLVSDLGLDPGKRSARFRIRARTRISEGLRMGLGTAGFLGVLLTMFQGRPSTWAAALASWLLLMLIGAVQPARLEVGTAGIEVRSLGSRRLFAYQDLRVVEKVIRDEVLGVYGVVHVRLTMANGRRHELEVGTVVDAPALGARSARAERIIQRILEASEAACPTVPPG